MRILQINKFHWLKGGSERYYFDLQNELKARGHEVAVFASRQPLNEPSPFEKYFAPEADYHGAGLLDGFKLARRVIHNEEAARGLRKLIEAFRPDIAHLHNFHHQLSPSILDVLHRSGVPIVQTLHDYKWVCPAYLFLSRGQVCERCGPGNRFGPVVSRRCHQESFLRSLVVYAESSRSWARRDQEKVARFLAPSRFLKERVIAHGLQSGRVVHMPYFIREDRYRPAVKPGEGFSRCSMRWRWLPATEGPGGAGR
jgi:glycosyltransferase involved in cell wall biosynthesis